MRKIIYVMLILSVLFGVEAAFAGPSARKRLNSLPAWEYVGKTTDGNAWYYDTKSIKVIQYTESTNYHINAVIRIVPAGNGSRNAAQKYGQPVGSIIERWRLHGREGFCEVVGRSVYNSSGKLIHRDNEKQCENDGNEWESGSIQEAIFDRIWQRRN